jgi:acyl-CoA reductase-like NAD-dependent aldehyde dehydrogenase
LLVQSEIKDALLERIVAGAQRCVCGDPLDERTTFGPLASAVQRDRVKRYLQQGLNEGAKAPLMGSVQESGGYFVSPTVFDGVDHSMSIVREEIFGPVLCVQCFRTEEEAFALANATPYGLAATVWTRDLGRGRRAAHAIRAGTIAVRSSAHEGLDSQFLLSYEPYGASGYGAEVGRRGVEAYSTLKTVSFAGQ